MRSFVWLFQVIEALILDDFLDERIAKMAFENPNYVFKTRYRHVKTSGSDRWAENLFSSHLRWLPPSSTT